MSTQTRILKKVLLVADDHDLLDRLFHSIHSAGYHVTPVKSGEDALKAVADYHVDCIVIDHALNGGMSGAELISKIRRMRLRMGVIMIANGDTDSVECLVEGMDVWAVLPHEGSEKEVLNKLNGAFEYSQLPEEKERVFISSVWKTLVELKQVHVF